MVDHTLCTEFFGCILLKMLFHRSLTFSMFQKSNMNFVVKSKNKDTLKQYFLNENYHPHFHVLYTFPHR